MVEVLLGGILAIAGGLVGTVLAAWHEDRRRREEAADRRRERTELAVVALLSAGEDLETQALLFRAATTSAHQAEPLDRLRRLFAASQAVKIGRYELRFASWPVFNAADAFVNEAVKWEIWALSNGENAEERKRELRTTRAVLGDILAQVARDVAEVDHHRSRWRRLRGRDSPAVASDDGDRVRSTPLAAANPRAPLRGDHG